MRLLLLTWIALAFLGPPAKAAPEGLALRSSLADLLEPETTAGAPARRREALLRLAPLAQRLSSPESLAALLEEAGLREVVPASGELSKKWEAAYRELGKAFAPADSSVSQIGEALAAQLRSNGIAALEPALQRLPDSLFLGWDPLLDAGFDQLRFSEHPTLVRMRESINGVEIRGATPDDIADVANAITGYFDRLPASRKRSIALEWLRLPPDATRARQLAAAVAGAGPAVQKLFQLVGGETKDPEVRAVLVELKANVRPISPEQAREVIERNLGQPIEAVFSEYEPTARQAGTIGQVHRARLRADGRQVAIKVQRPGVRERLQEDFKALRESLSHRPDALALLSKMIEQFETEADLHQDAAALAEMWRYRQPALGLGAPAGVAELPLMNDVLLMDWVPGKPMTKLDGIDPRLHRQALTQLAEAWFEEAFFGSGFFHGDLHPGNVMLELKPGHNPPFLATFIDPGSTGRLTLDERRRMVSYLIGILTRSPTDTLRALEQMAVVPTESREALLKQIQESLGRPGVPVFQRSNEILLAATKLRVDFASNYLLLGRSMEYLQQQISKANEAVHAVDPKARTYSLLHAYALRALRHGAREMPRQIVNPGAREMAVLELKLIPEAFGAARRGFENWFDTAERRQRRLEAAKTCTEIYPNLIMIP